LAHFKRVLFDRNKQNEKHKIYNKTDIRICDTDTGEQLFRGSNKIILPGAGFSARSHFDLSSYSEITPNYNDTLGLDQTYSGETPDSLHRTFLFAMGTDGCGKENSQVYNEKYGLWIPPTSLVPFKYQLLNNDLSAINRTKYFGRKTTSDRYAYYFKAFDSSPTFTQQFTDGMTIGSGIYDTTKTEEIESYVECILKITKEDCRDYFIATTGINDARINSISLLTCWAKTINGYDYYQDIRPLTKLNIPNESLIDLTKSITIYYQIYY